MKPRAGKTKPRRSRRRLSSDCVRYMEVQGKTVDYAELWTGPGNCSVTLWFQDKTCLHFNLEPEPRLGIQANYFDCKTGDQRVLKRWPVVLSD